MTRFWNNLHQVRFIIFKRLGRQIEIIKKFLGAKGPKHDSQNWLMLHITEGDCS